MRTIQKGQAPKALETWKRKNPNGTYGELGFDERKAVRQACLEEQFYLCAYCCKRIGTKPKDCSNEHVVPKHLEPQRQLDYANIVASCNSVNQCDSAHQAKRLPLTPLMERCETELAFSTNGRVSGRSQRARETIEILNLGDHERNNARLVQLRKQLCDELLLGYNLDAKTVQLEEPHLLKLIAEDLQKPQKGKLEAFSPVVVNILRGWLAS